MTTTLAQTMFTDFSSLAIDAADYATHLQAKGWKPSSVNSSLQVLRRALRLAVEWGIAPQRTEDQTSPRHTSKEKG